MPIFEVQDRDGKRYQIDAPDQDQALTAFKGMQGGASREKAAADIRGRNLDNMGWGEKALVNVGAGMQNMVDGASQVFGGGPTDAQVRERRNTDRELADHTTGGSALQVAGEIAPTLLVPGGAIARGVGLGGRGLAALAAESGIVGAATGAAMPVTADESRTFNAVLNGALGAAVPGLLAAAGKGVSYLTQTGAQSRAAKEIIKTLGGPERATEVLQQMAAHQEPAITSKVPLTPGEITQNPKLGMMERASAARDPASWAENVRVPQAQARDEALQAATAAADDLPNRVAQRETSANENYARAYADQPSGTAGNAAIVQDLTQRPAYQQAIKRAEASLKNRGLDPTDNPVRIAHEIKLQLDDAIESAMRAGNKNEARGVMDTRDRLLQLIERDDFSPSYRQARETYAAQSRPVEAAEGAAGIRGAVESVPLTGTRLARAVDKNGSNRFGNVLDDETRLGLEALQANLGRTEGLQRMLKSAGTSGGGSNTAMDSLAQAAESKLSSKLPFVGKFFERADSMTKAALADFLQSPGRFTAAVSKKLSDGRPLSRSEDAILRLARAASATSPELLLGQ